MIVGFIEPVGTSFQSAIAERKEDVIRKITSNGRIQSRQNLAILDFNSTLICITPVYSLRKEL